MDTWLCSVPQLTRKQYKAFVACRCNKISQAICHEWISSFSENVTCVHHQGLIIWLYNVAHSDSFWNIRNPFHFDMADCPWSSPWRRHHFINRIWMPLFLPRVPQTFCLILQALLSVAVRFTDHQLCEIWGSYGSNYENDPDTPYTVLLILIDLLLASSCPFSCIHTISFMFRFPSGHNYFLPNLFQFIIHLSYHRTLCILATGSIIK